MIICFHFLGVVPNCGYDGSRLCSDCRDLTLLIWIHQCKIHNNNYNNFNKD